MPASPDNADLYNGGRRPSPQLVTFATTFPRRPRSDRIGANDRRRRCRGRLGQWVCDRRHVRAGGLRAVRRHEQWRLRRARQRPYSSVTCSVAGRLLSVATGGHVGDAGAPRLHRCSGTNASGAACELSVGGASSSSGAYNLAARLLGPRGCECRRLRQGCLPQSGGTRTATAVLASVAAPAAAGPTTSAVRACCPQGANASMAPCTASFARTQRRHAVSESYLALQHRQQRGGTA